MPTIALKTSHNDPELKQKQTWFSQQPGCNWLTDITKQNENLFPSLKITRKGVYLNDGGQNLHFHPSMTLLRIMNIYKGNSDRYLIATGLKSGDTLLDLTMGLGNDALVGAWAVGEQGKVIGVEYSPVICALVSDGLQSLASNHVPKSKNPDKNRAWETLSLAAARIKVTWSDHNSFLCRQPSASADVVFFDPMFRYTPRKSASIKPLYSWSNLQSLRIEVIHESCRVARRCVVLKERKGSSEFSRLGFDILSGGKYSQVDYGLIMV
ncbi:MAG: class I SAM-dependent methyltransferase [Desulfitobacteriaceae bacterium]|nr:class I SAM-dependent methyltransferase [Desulfitobacteriaceae bacterium]MDD4346272.1 class I SAM-dependent methyltransferase [Desulfitobacteriaceae bacterium]MDD4400605.1 class I SAM-dependent methyltransferase [Desulfitobacteriaceae bacterium]